MSAATTRTKTAGRKSKSIILLSARWTCPNDRPTCPALGNAGRERQNFLHFYCFFISHKLKQGDINNIIREDNLKKKKEYSAYNFRSKEQKVRYERDGILPKNPTSIYNKNAIEYILEAFSSST